MLKTGHGFLIIAPPVFCPSHAPADKRSSRNGCTAGYEGALKLYGKEEQLAQKFASFFPEQTSDQERVAAFLSQDAALIRQDYIQTFSPPPDHRKKKRSGRKRE
jgi:hypothetical protein